MSETKFLKCSCQCCGGRIEYPAHAAGMTTECPHCHSQTGLTVEVPEMEQSIARPRLKWVVLGGFVVLALLGIAAPILLKKAVQRQRPAAFRDVARNTPTAKASAPSTAPRLIQNGFELGPVAIEPASAGSLSYVSGTVSNTVGRQRFSVRIELECLDAAGRVVATASDYIATFDANAEWRFRALVLKGKPTSARIKNISEQQ